MQHAWDKRNAYNILSEKLKGGIPSEDRGGGGNIKLIW
jgi:hypothetical protein